MLTQQIVRRVRAPFVVASGLVLAAIGFAVLTLASVFTLATDLVVGTAPPERAGSASALSETGRSSEEHSASRSSAASAQRSTERG
jgi:DHA2 family multidrug resistance protein-like MFS transporter